MQVWSESFDPLLTGQLRKPPQLLLDEAAEVPKVAQRHLEVWKGDGSDVAQGLEALPALRLGLRKVGVGDLLH